MYFHFPMIFHFIDILGCKKSVAKVLSYKLLIVCMLYVFYVVDTR